MSVHVNFQFPHDEMESRAYELAARLRISGRGITFLIQYLCLWRGPLGGVPTWLRTSAGRCERHDPQLSLALHSKARLEEEVHRENLYADLAELCANPIWARAARGWQPNLAVDRHMFVRTTIDPDDPYVTVALDYYHAELDVVLGKALRVALRGVLPWEVELRRFIGGRTDGAARRAWESQRWLGRLEKQCNPVRVYGWHTSALELIETYLDAVGSFIEEPAHLRLVVPDQAPAVF